MNDLDFLNGGPKQAKSRRAKRGSGLTWLIGAAVLLLVGAVGAAAFIAARGKSPAHTNLENLIERIKAPMTEAPKKDTKELALLTFKEGGICYFDDYNYFGTYVSITNRTKFTLSEVSFTMREMSKGRKVPWRERTFYTPIPGGLEPGETREVGTRWTMPIEKIIGDRKSPFEGIDATGNPANKEKGPDKFITFEALDFTIAH